MPSKSVLRSSRTLRVPRLPAVPALQGSQAGPVLRSNRRGANVLQVVTSDQVTRKLPSPSRIAAHLTVPLPAQIPGRGQGAEKLSRSPSRPLLPVPRGLPSAMPSRNGIMPVHQIRGKHQSQRVGDSPSGGPRLNLVPRPPMPPTPEAVALPQQPREVPIEPQSPLHLRSGSFASRTSTMNPRMVKSLLTDALRQIALEV